MKFDLAVDYKMRTEFCKEKEETDSVTKGQHFL